MSSAITLEGIDQAISNLNYKNENTLKFRYVQYIRQYYTVENAVVSLNEIDHEDLIKMLWNTDHDLETIKNKRKNLTSLRSSVNADFKKLYETGENPEGIKIGPRNIFIMSEDAKDKILKNIGYELQPDGTLKLDQIMDILKVANEAVSGSMAVEDTEKKDGSKKIDRLKDLIKGLSEKVGLGGDQTDTGIGAKTEDQAGSAETGIEAGNKADGEGIGEDLSGKGDQDEADSEDIAEDAAEYLSDGIDDVEEIADREDEIEVVDDIDDEEVADEVEEDIEVIDNIEDVEVDDIDDEEAMDEVEEDVEIVDDIDDEEVVDEVEEEFEDVLGDEESKLEVVEDIEDADDDEEIIDDDIVSEAGDGGGLEGEGASGEAGDDRGLGHGRDQTDTGIGAKTEDQAGSAETGIEAGNKADGEGIGEDLSGKGDQDEADSEDIAEDAAEYLSDGIDDVEEIADREDEIEVVDDIDDEEAMDEVEEDIEVIDNIEDVEVDDIDDEEAMDEVEEDVEIVDDIDDEEVVDEVEEEFEDVLGDEESKLEVVEDIEDADDDEEIIDDDIVSEAGGGGGLEGEGASGEAGDDRGLGHGRDQIDTGIGAKTEDQVENFGTGVETGALDEGQGVVGKPAKKGETEKAGLAETAAVIDEAALEEIDEVEALEDDVKKQQEKEPLGLPVDSLGQEYGLEADNKIEKHKLLAEEFDGYLGSMDRYYNHYVLIPGGEYLIGSKHPIKDEKPEQIVYLEPFYIGRYPVTNGLFEIFVEKTGYKTTAEKVGYGTVYYGRFEKKKDEKTGLMTSTWNASLYCQTIEGACWYKPSGPESTLYNKRNHPVVQISMEDAMAFAAWTGKRLPTENEWEAASRTAKGWIFPWGSEWNKDACNIEDSCTADTTPVDKYVEYENNFGIVDCLGNVLEWTNNSFEERSGTRDEVKYRAVKGGSWVSGNDIRLFRRFMISPESHSNILGFRCVAY